MKRKHELMLIVGIIFMAFNLRAPLTSIGSLIPMIRGDLGISNGLTGFITTLPLLTFAAFSPFVTKVSLKLGNGLTMLIAIVSLTLGEIIRSYTGAYGLFIGTVIISMGICIGNVLIPSIIKLKFPTKIGAITSIYTPLMSLSAAIASGVSIPLATGMNIGWRNALAVWTILGAVTLIIWLPQMRSTSKEIPLNNESKTVKSNYIAAENTTPIWKDNIAWYVTIFMGLQSILFYCFVAWLPTILQSRGLSAEFSGYMLSLLQLIAVPASFVVSQIADKTKNQKLLATITSTMYLLGTVGLLFGGSTTMLYIYIICMGLGSGGSISIALSFIGLRTSNGLEAGKLSGMAQSIGYTLGALGPFLIGVIYDITGSFTGPILFLIVTIICLIVFSSLAGQNKFIFENKAKQAEPDQVVI